MDLNNQNSKNWNKQYSQATAFQSPLTTATSMNQGFNMNQQMPQQDYKTQNEKFQIRIRYLEDFIDNMNGFEKTQSILDLKQFVNKNYRRFSMLLDEIYELKTKLEDEKTKFADMQNEVMQSRSKGNGNSSEVMDLRNKLLQYQQQMQQQDEYVLQLQNQQINNDTNFDFTSLNKDQLQVQISNLEETINKLSAEMEDLSLKNIKYREQLGKKDFFKEYDNMCKEVEGLRKQNQKLSDQIKGSGDQGSKNQKENQRQFNLFH